MLGAAAIATAAILPMTSVAQDASGEEVIEEVTVTGTRSKPRTATQSPVAIDTFNSAQLDQQPHGDLTENIKNLVPSFTATALTGDGSSFVRSTSLRGLPPDELLLLVNSKRRHRSALIQHFGAAMSAGAHAADMGPIPSIALKNVEVLRDGAAAQYGSDAIAGVINFLLKDADEGGEVQVQYGQFYEGEQSIKVAGNLGVRLGNDGFVNVSAEFVDHEQLSRGFQTANGQAAIDAGIPNVGADSPYDTDSFAQTWGRPENKGVRTAWNLGIPIGDNAEGYAFGNYADTYHNYRFFYREVRTPTDPNGVDDALHVMPIDPTDPDGDGIPGLPGAFAGNFCWCDVLPAGFTPYLTGDITDFSQVVGVRGEFANGTLYDFSGSYGMSRIDYILHNTISPTYGPGSETRAYRPGDLKAYDININVDFSTPVSDTVNVAYGFEWREETYVMFAGESESWIPGPWSDVDQLIDPTTGLNYFDQPNGSNGFPGTPTDFADSFSRTNVAIYVDVEWDITDNFLLQGAVRAEDFSDFGDTFNGKLAARFNVTDAFTIRASASTGFRAPTPGQSNVFVTVLTFDTPDGSQANEITLRPTDSRLEPLGGKELDSEDAVNISVGFTAEIGDSFTVTADYYQIDVDDRIVKTFNIDVTGNPDFDDLNASQVSFYTNGLNTETTGFDIVALWDITSDASVSLAWNNNETEISSFNLVNGVNPISSGTAFNIQNNLPENRFSASYNQSFGDFGFTARANWYDSAIDERGQRENISSATMVDIEGRYYLNDNITLVLGANNVFDEFPNEIDTRRSQGLAYPRRTPIGYDGGMWYLKGIYNFD